MSYEKEQKVPFVPMSSRQQRISYKLKQHSPEYAAGFLSSATNILLTYPVNKLIFRQQLYCLNTFAAYQQLKDEGFLILYRGMALPLLQKTFSLSIMFGANAHYLHILQSFSKKDYWFYQPIASALAGGTEAILTPLERIQVLLQTPKYNTSIRNGLHAFMLMYQHYGIIEYYRGVTLILIRNSVSNMIFFACRKPIKGLLPLASTDFEHSIYDFLSGGLLGALLSTLTYPINVLKNIQQSELGGRHDRPLQILRSVYEQRGHSIKEFYIGAKWNFIRSLVSWGIINSTYEYYLTAFQKVIVDDD
ncbi:unnamed protein product [Rotaria sp. Silwood2]|nr:unnamed protein product [Rotaria sp. Silwood2]CAF2622593.1 unnamed protein product [Rotaria sp. Silwood2]CAF2890354.1 unnamed protein product [Rotaria sp. Silwood2]CAF3028932.1 unnamed protein product [Rotaria sp. Silwood2]CAF3995024.1 unnamed protein product [Rotaria sp. Silwood2]